MSHERRVFVDLKQHSSSEEIKLSALDSNHLAKVLRLGSGDPVLLVDSSSQQEYNCFIARIDQFVYLKLDKATDRKEYRSVVDTLLLGFCKQAATETAIEKATELGVSTIILAETDHSVIKLNKGAGNNKKERLLKIVEAASKQSSRLSIPEILIFQNLDDCLAKLANSDLNGRFYGSLQPVAKKVKAVACDSGITRAVVAIGPEGDFSAREIQLLENNNFIPFSLGGNRLKAETAVVAGIAAFDAVF